MQYLLHNHNPFWKFEVKARSTTYSFEDGVTDLIEMCGDKDSIGLYHAMLIGVRAEGTTEIYAWSRDDSDGMRYARIVILLAAARRSTIV